MTRLVDILQCCPRSARWNHEYVIWFVHVATLEELRSMGRPSKIPLRQRELVDRQILVIKHILGEVAAIDEDLPHNEALGSI